MERATRQRFPLLATHYVAIEASSALLEALIASLLPAFGPTKEANFSDGNQALDCHRIIGCLRRWRVGNDAVMRVEGRLQHIVASAHSSLDARNTYS